MNPGPSASHLRRTLWIAASLLAVYTVTGFFLAPPIIRSQLERRAGAALGRTVTVGRVRVNPFAVSLTLENLDVRLKEGDGSFLGWTRLYVNFDPLDSVFGAWTLGAVELDGFHVTALLKQDGTFNFADIIARLNEPAPAPSAGPARPVPPVRVVRLEVRGARLDFVDQSRPRPFATTLGPVSFNLTDFSSAVAVGAPYRFEAVTETGEKLAWSGTLSAVPLASTGELRLENINLPKYAPYYADRLQAELTGGKLSLSGRYEAKFDANGKVLKLAGGALQLRDLQLVGRASQAPLVELPLLEVSEVSADALAMKAMVGSVVLAGGHVHVRREADGSINLLNLLPPPPVAPAPVPPAPPPDFLIGEVTLKDFAVDLTDLAAPRPAQLGLTGLQLSLKKVTLADGAEMPLSLALGWAPAGTVTLAGTVTIKPELKATLQTEVAALALLPVSPYIEKFLNAHLTKGTVSTSGLVHVALAGGAPALTFDGGVRVENLGLVDGVHNEELAGFASLALTGLKAATAPSLAVSLAGVSLAAPYARVIVNQDGSLNLAMLAKAAPTALNPVGGALRSDPNVVEPPLPSAVGQNATPAPPPRIEIARVTITDGDFTLTDRSLEPNVRVAINHFGGTVSGLSSQNLARADVDLQATVDGAGPIAITGKLDPLGAKKFVDLKVDFKNVNLLPFSPYSGKYAGYELARGQLNVDVHAKLDDRQLDVTNVITLNQFTFGPLVSSPDATKLPVRLGVALLKDMNGQIVIDVPMAGSIDDPSLRIGKVVLRVVVNLLTKAAVSPFALLGSMFGGGGDELAYQEFAPGDSQLRPAEATKLATLTQALTHRPGLSLAIEGGYDGPADTYALKRQRLAALVRNKVWEERHAIDPNIATPEQLEIPPEAHAAMVKKLFDQKFPPGTELGAPLPPAPVVTVAPPAAKKGFIRRVVAVFTSGAAPAKPASAAAAPVPISAATGGPSLEEMSGRLAETMVVTDDDLRALADARAQGVRDYFQNVGQVAPDRLFLAHGQPVARENKGPRVFLSLQ